MFLILVAVGAGLCSAHWIQAKKDVILIGRSRTPPLRDTIIYYILTNNKYGNSEKQKLESIEK